MSKRSIFGLFALNLLICATVAMFQSFPGYMDADYYFAIGQRLASNQGFTQPFLWNYLSDFPDLPVPSNAYWMPMASLISMGGILITGRDGFMYGKLVFLLLAALVSPLTMMLGYRMTSDKRKALLSGILAAFSGFYLPFLSTSDTFAIYWVSGALFFLLLPIGQEAVKFGVWFGLGVLGGVMHLSRADGLLWIAIALVALYLYIKLTGIRSGIKTLGYAGYILLGYFCVMAPWFLRNISVFGAITNPVSLKTLWMTEYNDLFLYPSTQLTFERWWNSGLENILHARFVALIVNLQRVLAEQGLIFLLPLGLLGLWGKRNDYRIKVWLLAWLGIFTTMTVLFPFAGTRGGLFHSGAALQSLFLVMVPIGLETAVRWASRLRNWEFEQALRFFFVSTVAMTVLLTGFITIKQITDFGMEGGKWGANERNYQELDGILENMGAYPDDRIMVNNAPGYYLVTKREAFGIPNAEYSDLLNLAKKYSIKYLIVDPNLPDSLKFLYQLDVNHPGLSLAFVYKRYYVYEFQQ